MNEMHELQCVSRTDVMRCECRRCGGLAASCFRTLARALVTIWRRGAGAWDGAIKCIALFIMQVYTIKAGLGRG